MSQNPLAEVFGFPVNNLSPEAERVRRGRLCPFMDPNRSELLTCNKDKKDDPLGTCSIMDGDTPTITCPVRFRQDWLIARDAAEFFGFAPGTWIALPEVRLNDKNGRSAGNIDVVVACHDSQGHILDFGSLEVQAVYISGNVRQPFEHYMADREGRKDMIWTGTSVRPDYLSSSRKRLLPQLVYKGRILKSWGKKQAVALHKNFFATLPESPTVPPREAEVAWLVYDLRKSTNADRYDLVLDEVIYTEFEPALLKITSPEAGPMGNFMDILQRKFDKK